MCTCCFFFFFFQAEDGIRDLTVTGVQTCALPIFDTLNSVLINTMIFAFVPMLTEREDAARVALFRRLNLVFTRVDRKSTRLNSSHSQISYAVFCLKKKKPSRAAALHCRPRPRPAS